MICHSLHRSATNVREFRYIMSATSSTCFLWMEQMPERRDCCSENTNYLTCMQFFVGSFPATACDVTIWSVWMATPALSLRKGMLFPDQTQWIPDPCVFLCVCEAFDSPVTLEQTKACFHSLVCGRVRMHVYAFHGRCITIASFICQIETNYEIQWSEHFRIESDVVCFDSVDELDDFWSPCESSWMYMFVQKCLAQKILEYR